MKEELDFLQNFEVEINNKKYQLKYTIGSWLGLEDKGITTENINRKIEETPFFTISNLLFFGLPAEVRKTITLEEFAELIPIDQLNNLGSTIQKAVQNSLPQTKEETSSSSKKNKSI